MRGVGPAARQLSGEAKEVKLLFNIMTRKT
jgi:hypothetical protein